MSTTPTPDTIFRHIRADARGWWYHRQLRDQGQAAEARRREHNSARGKVQHIREALAAGGFLSIGRGGFALHMTEHSTLSGYDDLSGHFPRACVLAGVPTIDTTTITADRAIYMIRLPMIQPGLKPGQVDECPEPDALFAGAVEDNAFGAMLRGQAAAKKANPGTPGPLDSIALEDGARLYAALGATLYNIPQPSAPQQ